MAENPDAYPRPFSESENQYHPASSGMTLLDYFAGQALAGTLAGPTLYLEDAAVVRAYKLANAMLIERQKHIE